LGVTDIQKVLDCQGAELREDLEQLTALYESEGGEDSGSAVEKSKLIISALKKGVQWRMI
jgi:hypothetical protein